MLNRRNTSLHGFTLVELVIVIAVIWIVLWFSQSIDLNEINKWKNAELFTTKISRLFENTRNNSLLWRSIGLVTPSSWRIRFDRVGSGTFTTEYFDGSSWQLFDDSDYNFVVDDPEFIDSISCNNVWDVSSGSWIIVFEWSTLTLSGSCSINDKIMTIGTYYSTYTGAVLINSVSGVIETQ